MRRYRNTPINALIVRSIVTLLCMLGVYATFHLYNVLQGSDKNIVICQQYTYSPEPHMGSLFNASIQFS